MALEANKLREENVYWTLNILLLLTLTKVVYLE